MSLLALTKRNLKRNFQLYGIYLVSMILGVVIHFTFSALTYNEDILNAVDGKEYYQIGVQIGSVVMFLFIVFFILYANTFFMKQRTKEFGMYLLFGMSERQIALMVFYETVFIVAISLVVGLAVGGVLSKFFGTILMNLMHYEGTVTISFPIESVVFTSALFLLLALFITAQSYLMIKRVQLIELFHAKEKQEKPIRPSLWVALLSITLLGASLYVISLGTNADIWHDHPSISMISVVSAIIFGTYLFFRQFTGWLLSVVRKRKRYHEGDTALWTGSMRFQAKGNALTLTFISLFSVVLIFLVGFVLINYKVQFSASRINLPNDIAFQTLDKEKNAEIDAIIANSDHNAEYHYTLNSVKTAPVSDREVAFENSGYYLPEVYLVSEQSYNDLKTLRGDGDLIDLSGNETVSLSQGTDAEKKYAKGEEPEIVVSTGEQEVALDLVEKQNYALLGWVTDPDLGMQKKPALLVVSNEAYQAAAAQGMANSFEIYQVENSKQAGELSEDVHAVVSEEEGAYYSSFADLYSIQIENSSLLLFASSFLAAIAIFALASVIYFKQLREATEEERHYQILGKMGMEERQMKSVIRKQQFFVFFPPLLLGILESGFMIKYFMLDNIQGITGLGKTVVGLYIVYFIIYFFLYLSSTKLYYRIVRQRR